MPFMLVIATQTADHPELGPTFRPNGDLHGPFYTIREAYDVWEKYIDYSRKKAAKLSPSGVLFNEAVRGLLIDLGTNIMRPEVKPPSRTEEQR